MSMEITGLDPATIDALLKGNLKKEQVATKGYARCIQIGPIRYSQEHKTCASRGCGTSTYLRVDGIPYCTTHGLHYLNRMFLNNKVYVDMIYDLSICDCNPGKYSNGQCHAPECLTVSPFKEPEVTLGGQ